MAVSVDKRFEEYYNLGLTEHNKNKEAKKQTAESDKQIVNTNADTSIKSITDGYNTQIADTEESYENAFQRNELQVKLNERYLERKAAEMGLTDSGMNRTQMTANQLSYANQKGELTRQRQKAVDTLAAAMRSKITEVDTNRNNQIAQIDSTLNNDLAQMDLDYASDARQRATDTYNAEYKAEKELEAERIKAKKEATEKAETDKNSLIKNLNDENVSEVSKKIYFEDYVSKYGVDENVNAMAQENGIFLAAGKAWNRSEFSISEAEDKGKAIGGLAQIFHSNKYDKSYKKAAFALFYDMYGIPDDSIIDGLLYASNMSEKELMGGI